MEGMADVVGGPDCKEKCIIISQTSRNTCWNKNKITRVYILKAFSYDMLLVKKENNLYC